MIARSRREGVTVAEVGVDVPAADVDGAELAAIDRRWLRDKGWHVKELTLMIGERGGPHDQRRRLFVARADGRIVGYVSYSPVFGERSGWLYDLTRRLPDAPPGVVEHVFAEAAQRMAGEGADWLHLGFTPFVGLDDAFRIGTSHSRVLDGLIRRIGTDAPWLYPAAGQVAFKLKWAPHLVTPEYLAVPGRPRRPGRAVLRRRHERIVRPSMTPHFDLDTPPIWRWHLNPPSRPSHHGTVRADVLVVGGGLAGVAGAYHLAGLRPDLDIVLVDALQVGLGATGASTGIVGPGLSAPLPALRRRYGDALTRAAFASTRAGAAEVRRVIETERIDCDLRRERHVVGALTDGQLRRMHRHTAALAELGHPVQWWDATTTAQRLGGAYRAAFSYEDVLLVNPFQLVTGLAAAAERRGVRIFERTRVTGLDHRSDAVVATTAGGTIIAGQVLLAVDGYAGALNPHPAAVVPVRTHVVATAPLTDEQRAALGWDGVGGVIDQRNFFNYYRLGAGDRLIFGGGPAVHPTGDPQRDARASADVFSTLEKQLRRRFPALDACRCRPGGRA